MSIQVIDRAIGLLQAVTDHGGEASLSELVKATGLSTSTCHRLLQSLTENRLLRLSAPRRYAIGPRILTLAYHAERRGSARGICEPTVRELRGQTGHTTMLILRDGYHSYCAHRIDGDMFIETLTGRVGGRVPLGVGPGSLAILSQYDLDTRTEILAHNSQAFASFRNCSREMIIERCERAITDGFALDLGEMITGVAGLSRVLLDQSGRAVGSIGFTMFVEEASETHLEHCRALLHDATTRLQPRLSPDLFDA